MHSLSAVLSGFSVSVEASAEGYSKHGKPDVHPCESHTVPLRSCVSAAAAAVP